MGQYRQRTAKKVTAAERVIRIKEITKLLYRHMPRRAILQYAAKNNWDLSDRAIDDYIKKANDIITIENADDRRIEYYKIKNSYQELLVTAYQEGRYGEMRVLLKDYAEFLGLKTLNINLKADISLAEKRIIEYMSALDVDELVEQA